MCGTESWLHGIQPGKPPSTPHIKSSEVFPSNYTAYRNDRNSFGGGVFTLVKDDLVSNKELGLISDCELEWVKIQLPRNKHLYIGNYYMPRRNLKDIKELDKSLQQLFNKPNSKSAILLGDFNCPNIDWMKQQVDANAPDHAVQQALLNITSPCLNQIHESPTREQKILDLVFTTNPTLTKSSVSIPGLSDHDAIVTDMDIKPSHSQKQRRRIYKYQSQLGTNKGRLQEYFTSNNQHG